MREAAKRRVRELGARVAGMPRLAVEGRVRRIVGQVIEASPLEVAMGEVCRIAGSDRTTIDAEVVGFHHQGVQLMPRGSVEGICPGARVRALGRQSSVEVGDGLLGRVLDGLGHPMDGRPLAGPTRRYPLVSPPPNPLRRARITEPLTTGVRSIDGLLGLGRGQRIGVFAGSGVGKSVLMGMMARNTSADVNVIALLGERGREVREFIERNLAEDGLSHSVVIVATSDQPALVRATGALVATAVAEYFRDAGKDVLLMVDSITRVAMAWREIGLSVGEPPTTKGYPPSIFAALSRLLERAGTAERGSISGLYTVLVEGDDFNEPVADATRSTLDGHIVLSRRLAAARHFPAVDVLESVSRVRDVVVDPEHLSAADVLLQLEAAYRDNEDLITVGAYKGGGNPRVDTAIALRQDLQGLLCQDALDRSTWEETRLAVQELAQRATLQIEGQAA